MSSTSSPLQSSFTVDEFIAALQQIVVKNDPCDRSEENVSIILTSKIQLIFSNRTNQDLLQALGEFFMWMMPYTESFTGTEREAEDEQEERGRKICCCKDVEKLFVHHLLPCAKSSETIYLLCRSVCRIAWKLNNTNFVTAAARDELLKLVKIAPCEKSRQWALKAIYNLANAKKDGVPIESSPFVCDEVSTFAYKLFCDSTAPKIVEIAADLLRMQVVHSTPHFITSDPDFAQKMLRKLDEATETGPMSSIANLIGNILGPQRGNRNHFASGEAARVFLSKLTSSDDPEVLQQVCLCISCAVATLADIADDFTSPEMCRAIFKKFSKQTDENSKRSIVCSIVALTARLPRVSSTFAQECPDLTQAIIETLTTATDDETRRHVAAVVANIALDAESAKRLFNNVSLYEALIHAASLAQNDETKHNLMCATRNATITCSQFRPLCAARYPFYDEKQIELLQLDSLDSLVLDSKNNGWAFATPQNAGFLKLRSISIVLEKFDQFLEVLDERIEKGNANIEEMFLAIAIGFSVMVQTCWEPLLGDPFFDVALSLLERSSGAANVVFVKIIHVVVKENPLLPIHPSTTLRLLQKLDNCKELRDREHNGADMEFDIYMLLQIALLFCDNNFLVDNSALIRSCFERSFEIHHPNAKDKSLLEAHVEALFKIDPRMKEKMEGWNRPNREVA